MKGKYWDLVKKWKGIDNTEIPERECLLMMKQLGIPHKRLFFYDTKGKHTVEKWKVADFYGDSTQEMDKFHTSLEIETQDGLKRRILAVYFSSMQRTEFKRNTSEREGWKH